MIYNYRLKIVMKIVHHHHLVDEGLGVVPVP
jgi:hypothetical protein